MDGDDKSTKENDAVPEAVLDIRHTPEYAAAWDLELWRALQTAKIQKELKERERKAMEEMRVRVQQKEKSELALVEKKMRDCAVREAALAKATEALEKRKAKLKDLEGALRKQLDETDAFRQRLDSETDARVARVKEEAAHKLELQHQRLVEAQEQIVRSDDRAANAQKEYLKLWDEFSDFKTRMLSQSGPQLAQQLDAMRAQNESNMMIVVERYDKRVSEMQHRHSEDLRAAHLELKKASEALATKREQCKSANITIATLTEERDGARAEIRRLGSALQHAEQTAAALKQELDNAIAHSRAGKAAQAVGTAPLPPRHANPHHIDLQALRGSISRVTAEQEQLHDRRSGHQSQHQQPSSDSPARAAARADIERLSAERDSLLRDYGGVYNASSPIVLDIEKRIRAAMHFLSTEH